MWCRVSSDSPFPKFSEYQILTKLKNLMGVPPPGSPWGDRSPAASQPELRQAEHLWRQTRRMEAAIRIVTWAHDVCERMFDAGTVWPHFVGASTV